MTAPQLAPGTVVAGKYSVGTCFGYGGSAATYHAASADGREVALKIFDPALRQRNDVMAELERVYAATNALPRDVSVPLLDAGYDPATGAPFSVTERLAIPSLAQLVSQRPLTPEELTNVLNMIARLLDYAHARQICHHALRPTNVFVGLGASFSVRVTDFGAGLIRSAVPTSEGYAAAAPWLAPEQVQGGVPAGPAADVFSLALLAFFALTGRSYWRSCQGQIDMAAWQREIMSPRVAPSARARELGVTLNSAFDTALGTALALDPSQRYRSSGELANAIEALVSSKGPESQATMAFPAMMLPGAGEYPPPPAPTGGLGMSPPGGPQAGGGASAAQAAAKLPAASEPASLAETTSGRPVDPNIHRRSPKTSTTKLVPIIVGLVIIALLGSTILVLVLMGKKGSGPEAAASASASALAAAASAPSASAAPAPSDTAPPPADSATAAPSSSANAPPPDAVEVAVTCDPGCDEIKIDDQVADTTQPVMIAPGKHKLELVKKDYKTLTDNITLTKGKKFEKKYKLSPEKPEKPAGPAPAPGPAPGPAPAPGPKAPCGKFLKKCK